MEQVHCDLESSRRQICDLTTSTDHLRYQLKDVRDQLALNEKEVRVVDL